MKALPPVRHGVLLHGGSDSISNPEHCAVDIQNKMEPTDSLLGELQIVQLDTAQAAQRHADPAACSRQSHASPRTRCLHRFSNTVASSQCNAPDFRRRTDLQRAQRRRRRVVGLVGGRQRRCAAQQLPLLRAALHAVVQVPHLVAALHLPHSRRCQHSGCQGQTCYRGSSVPSATPALGSSRQLGGMVLHCTRTPWRF